MKYKIKNPTPARHPAGTIIEPLFEDSNLFVTEKIGNYWNYYFLREEIENDLHKIKFDPIINETN